jgi:ribosomal protein S4
LLYKKNYKVFLTKKFNWLIKLLELRIDVIICKLFFCFHIKYAKFLITAQTIYVNNTLCKKIIICNIYDEIQINIYSNSYLQYYYIKISTKLYPNLTIKQIKFTSKVTKNYLEVDFKILKAIIIRIPYYTELTNPFISLKKNFVKILYNNLKFIYRLY